MLRGPTLASSRRSVLTEQDIIRYTLQAPVVATADTPAGAIMATTRPPLRHGEIRITHSHLAALGVATAATAALSFLLGLELGQLGAGATEAESTAAFTPAPLADDELESMLREVELARSALAPSAELPLSFPQALTGAADPSLPVEIAPGDGTASETEPLADAGPQPPPLPAVPAPHTGWSVQVATSPDLPTAEARRDQLIEDGYDAYVVSSFVDGQSWYRVRVGGFGDAGDAEEARAALSVRLGHDALALTVAP